MLIVVLSVVGSYCEFWGVYSYFNMWNLNYLLYLVSEGYYSCIDIIWGCDDFGLVVFLKGVYFSVLFLVFVF